MPDENVNSWVVRHAKGRQQFRQRTRSRPLVVCQDFNRLGRVGQLLGSRQDSHLHGGLDGLLQVGKVGVVWRQVHRGYPASLARCESVEPKLDGLSEPRIAGDEHLQVFERLGAAVGQSKGPNNRHGVLDGRVTQGRVSLDFDGDAR